MPLITRFVFASELVANLSPVLARAYERPQVQTPDLSYSLGRILNAASYGGTG